MLQDHKYAIVQPQYTAVSPIFLTTLVYKETEKQTIAIHEVKVRDGCGILTSIHRVAALKYLGVWSSFPRERLRLEGIVVKLVEVAFEGEVVFCLRPTLAFHSLPLG